MMLSTEAGLKLQAEAIDTFNDLALAAKDFYFRYGSDEAGSIDKAVAVRVPRVDESLSAIDDICKAVHAVVRPLLASSDRDA
jgi:hypothetical protein